MEKSTIGILLDNQCALRFTYLEYGIHNAG